eukprot:GEMP01076983.1.p1 GENE.GEMP01076983.1~~GEMP01076983.1.p1  ORF type:complete len:271 (+),score=-33.97 GEMP01076983.1:39-851(+)
MIVLSLLVLSVSTNIFFWRRESSIGGKKSVTYLNVRDARVGVHNDAHTHTHHPHPLIHTRLHIPHITYWVYLSRGTRACTRTCMYACMFVYVGVYLYMFANLCVRICLSVCLYARAHVCLYVCFYTFVGIACICLCMFISLYSVYVCVCVFMFAYVCVCLFVRMYPHTHTLHTLKTHARKKRICVTYTKHTRVNLRETRKSRTKTCVIQSVSPPLELCMDAFRATHFLIFDDIVKNQVIAHRASVVESRHMHCVHYTLFFFVSDHVFLFT